MLSLLFKHSYDQNVGPPNSSTFVGRAIRASSACPPPQSFCNAKIKKPMAPECRAPCTLPNDYHRRWIELAEWSCTHQHGPASRYAIMYALTLRRSVLADRMHITFVSPRVWEVKDRLATSQRIALFDDKLVERLLHNIDSTADFPTPLFPNCACGSHRTDDWAHGLASRKSYRGYTNFQALSTEFDIAAGPQWTPLEIYLVSLCVLRNSITFAPHDECTMLMHQLGVKLPKNVFLHAHWFRMESLTPVGTARLKDGQTVFSLHSPLSESVASTATCCP